MFGNEVFFDGKSMENVSQVEVLKVPEVILHILGCKGPLPSGREGREAGWGAGLALVQPARLRQ